MYASKCSYTMSDNWNASSSYSEYCIPHFHLHTDECTLRQIMRQFGYGPAQECYHCESQEWYNICYHYRYNWDYILCYSCYRDLPWDQKEDWERVEAPWCRSVPSYTLSRGDEGDEVRQLQYFLTRLGVMPLSATDELTGCFGPRTERAIREFQHICGFKCYSGEYDKDTARMLERIVSYYRCRGHKYL